MESQYVYHIKSLNIKIMNVKRIFREIITVLGIFGLINIAVLFANISSGTHSIKVEVKHSNKLTSNQIHDFDKGYFKYSNIPNPLLKPLHLN